MWRSLDVEGILEQSVGVVELASQNVSGGSALAAYYRAWWYGVLRSGVE